MLLGARVFTVEERKIKCAMVKMKKKICEVVFELEISYKIPIICIFYSSSKVH